MSPRPGVPVAGVAGSPSPRLSGASPRAGPQGLAQGPVSAPWSGEERSAAEARERLQRGVRRVSAVAGFGHHGHEYGSELQKY